MRVLVTKACTKCREELPVDDFGPDGRASDGKQSSCRGCRRDHQRDLYASDPSWRARKRRQAKARYEADPQVAYEQSRQRVAANPDKARGYGRKSALKSYGLTSSGYDTVLALQGGHCALCPAVVYRSGSRHLGVDHDHSCCPGRKSCGRCIRGLLCVLCNGEVERVSSGERQGAPDVVAYLRGRPQWAEGVA